MQEDISALVTSKSTFLQTIGSTRAKVFNIDTKVHTEYGIATHEKFSTTYFQNTNDSERALKRTRESVAEALAQQIESELIQQRSYDVHKSRSVNFFAEYKAFNRYNAPGVQLVEITVEGWFYIHFV